MHAQLWRAVVLFRVLAVIYAAALFISNRGGYAHPSAGFGVLAGLVVWTALTAVWYPRGTGGRWLVAVDVAVAIAAIGFTRYVDTSAHIADGAPTLAAAWGAAPVLAAALVGGPWIGLVAALLIAGTDVWERGSLAQTTFNGVVLLVIVGVVGGYVARLLRRAERVAQDAARREAAAAGLEAATSERARLARDIHDSVLQVLTLISRRGRELGGEAAELAALAGAQEAALRSLVAEPLPAAVAGAAGRGLLDVRALLPAPCSQLSVALPGDPVLLPEVVARAVAGAAGEALANVERHAGVDSQAWVLVEDDGVAVTLSVRDDGCGFGPGRLNDAARSGRLGVAQSILERARSVGGEAVVTSVPGEGTEVEIRVPRS